jgi:hypothetical protein
MPALTTFRLLGIHLIGLLGGIYIAAGLARFLASFWPDAGPPTFIIASLFFTCGEVSMTIRELHKGRLSTGIIILDFMPFLLLGGGVSLFLGRLAARWFGSDMGGLIVFFGVYYCVLLAIAGVKYTVKDRNLKEDLEKSPPAIRFDYSNSVTDTSTHLQDTEEVVPRSYWTPLQNIAKAFLVIIVLALLFVLLLSLLRG